MSVNASFKTVWSREMQEVLWPGTVWTAQANFRLEAELKDGDKIKRMIPSKMVPTDYTRYNDVSPQRATTTAEELAVDKTPVIPFEHSDLDDLQSTPKNRQKFTDMAVEQINTVINGHYTAEVANALSVIDASHFSGTAGLGADITVNNIDKMFALSQKKLGRQNVYRYKPGESPFFANITPDVYQVLLERLSGRESVLGDKLYDHGHAGMYYNFDLYVHNAGYWTSEIYMPVNPTNGDTITIQIADQTITVTFVDTLSAATGASEVHITASVDATRANLVEFLNSPGSSEAEDTNAGYSSMSTDHQAVMYGSTWTNSNSADTATVTWRGVGAPIMAETFTSASNVITTGKSISHNMFGRKGAVDFVIQRAPKIQIDQMEKRVEENLIKIYTLFGKKTFSDGARKLVNVKVATNNYV